MNVSAAKYQIRYGADLVRDSRASRIGYGVSATLAAWISAERTIIATTMNRLVSRPVATSVQARRRDRIADPRRAPSSRGGSESMRPASGAAINAISDQSRCGSFATETATRGSEGLANIKSPGENQSKTS